MTESMRLLARLLMGDVAGKRGRSVERRREATEDRDWRGYEGEVLGPHNEWVPADVPTGTEGRGGIYWKRRT